jgi:hypothetical protein
MQQAGSAAPIQENTDDNRESGRRPARQALCPYVEGDFLVECVRIYTQLPNLDTDLSTT